MDKSELKSPRTLSHESGGVEAVSFKVLKVQYQRKSPCASMFRGEGAKITKVPNWPGGKGLVQSSPHLSPMWEKGCSHFQPHRPARHTRVGGEC